MNNFTKDQVTSCRFCRYYAPEGRRGGGCQKLDAFVHAEWEACSLSEAPFDSSWENSMENIFYTDRLILLSKKHKIAESVSQKSTKYSLGLT